MESTRAGETAADAPKRPARAKRMLLLHRADRAMVAPVNRRASARLLELGF